MSVSLDNLKKLLQKKNLEPQRYFELYGRCAFIEVIKDKPVSEKELIDFCKETLASFKVPKKVEFCELPKTSTGKIQKFELRKKAKELN